MKPKSQEKSTPSAAASPRLLSAPPRDAFGTVNIFQVLGDVSQIVRDARSGGDRSKLVSDFMKLAADLGINFPQSVAEAMIPM